MVLYSISSSISAAVTVIAIYKKLLPQSKQESVLNE
jgi:hypothetical protein